MTAKRLAALINELLDEEAKVCASAQPPELITMKEVCRLNSISRATGFRLLRKGLLKPVYLPGTRATRFRRADVLALAHGEGK